MEFLEERVVCVFIDLCGVFYVSRMTIGNSFNWMVRSGGGVMRGDVKVFEMGVCLNFFLTKNTTSRSKSTLHYDT